MVTGQLKNIFQKISSKWIFFKKFLQNEKSLKNITFNYKIIDFPNIFMLGMLLYVI
jgi:hypothetical protein